MPKAKDLTGVVKGNLYFLESKGCNEKGVLEWLCRCLCGNYLLLRTATASPKTTTISCGCVNQEKRKARAGVLCKGKTPATALTLVGCVFGRLTVIKRSGSSKNNRCLWECQCSCGNIKISSSISLASGDCTSCGCVKDKYKSQGASSQSRIYKIWQGMKKRCHPIRGLYDYGQRGIRVCDEWNSDFLAFYIWAIGNEYSEELTIDRVDPDGNYEPGNCRWATVAQQARNKRNTYYVELEGVRYCFRDLLDLAECPYNPQVVKKRIKRGWTVQEAMWIPRITGGDTLKNPKNYRLMYRDLIEEKLNEFRLKQNKASTQS